MQLCFVLFGHKHLTTNGKQLVDVLVDKVKKKQEEGDCGSLLCKTFKADFKRKELSPLLFMIFKRKVIPITKFTVYFLINEIEK